MLLDSVGMSSQSSQYSERVRATEAQSLNVFPWPLLIACHVKSRIFVKSNEVFEILSSFVAIFL